jgi:hypothetical protein
MDASESHFSFFGDQRLWEELERLRSTVGVLRQEGVELRQENAKRKQHNAKLEKQNAKHQAEVDRLKQEKEDSERNSKRQTSRFPRRERKANPKSRVARKGSSG